MANSHDAERILTDPAWEAATTALEAAIVKQLSSLDLNGSKDVEAHALELIRLLQAGKKYQRLLWSMIDQGKLKEADLERKKRWNLAGIR